MAKETNRHFTTGKHVSNFIYSKRYEQTPLHQKNKNKNKERHTGDKHYYHYSPGRWKLKPQQNIPMLLLHSLK